MRTSICRRLIGAIVVLSATMGLAGPAAGEEFFFKPKDRILFLGDSITEQYDYTNFLEYYLTTRFPKWDLVFFNAGIGGDTAGGGNNRAVRDVLSEKPTAVTINFGMNDGGYKAPDDNIFKNYIKNQTALTKKLTDAQVRVALMATSPVEGRKRKDGEVYNETLGKFGDALKVVAKEHGATHVDQFNPALAVLRKLAEDKAAIDCFPDSVHTNARGGLLMAHSILTGMHAPALVSDVALEANGKVTAAEGCKVTDTKAQNGTISFSRFDDALPLVLSPDQKALAPYLDNLSKLNRYGLKVSGLDKDAKYDLKIDGKKVATYTGEQLGKSVNLAMEDLGPISVQSGEVLKAMLAKNQLMRFRYNNYRRTAVGAPPLLSEEEQKQFAGFRTQELAMIDKALETQRKKVYELAQPKAHQFELSRAN
ncbi:MAG: SGNH/GDSL hydrolase family protein [Gemmataceae bacterium]|nr:SGNH/GDSL hydrolase family protein [Gemmataceae bacterium]